MATRLISLPLGWRVPCGAAAITVLLTLGSCGSPLAGPGVGVLDAVDALADRLAGRIAAGDDVAAALAEALAAAGIEIGGAAPSSVVEGATNPWFLLLDDLALGVLVEGSRKRLSLPYGDVIKTLEATFDEFDDADFSAIIINDIREAAAADDPALRFWGRFIVALGREAPEPFDLLDEVDPEDLELSLLQMTLITLRLLAGIYGFIAPDLDPVEVASVVRPSGDGCTLEGIQAHVVDVAGVGLLRGNGALLEYLVRKRVSGAAAARRVLKGANFALAYVKLAWTMVAFEGSLEMPNGPYLVRTKSTTTYGETQGFVYRASYHTSNARWVNCFRLMLAINGIEFSLPDDGAIGGAKVNWRPLSGFGVYGTPALLQWKKGFNPFQVTDSEGVSHGFVDGVPQRKRLPSRLREVHKPAMVGVDVVVQPASMFRDLLDATGTSLLTLPADLLMRTRWAFNSQIPFTVIDWEDACTAPHALATAGDEACVDEWVGETLVVTSGELAGADLRIEVSARVVWRPISDTMYAPEGTITWTYRMTTGSCDVTARADDVPIEPSSGWLSVNPTPSMHGGQGYVVLGTVAFTETCPDGVTVYDLPNQGAEWFNALPDTPPFMVPFDPGGPLEGTLTFTYGDATTVSSWIFTR
jgi:hypothetical protein